jgi:hypothetical protein
MWCQPDKILSGAHTIHGGEDANDEELVQVVVKRTGAAESASLYLSMDPSATVHDLKTTIQEELANGVEPREHIPIERMRLVFSGRMLTNEGETVVSDLKMKTDAINYIHLIPIPKGAVCSLRKNSENVTSRRSASREQRRHHPYRTSVREHSRHEQGAVGGPDNGPVQQRNHLLSSHLNLSSLMTHAHLQALHQHQAVQGPLPGESTSRQLASLEGMLHQMPTVDVVRASGVENLIMLQQALLQDVNDLIPHCHNLSNLLNRLAYENTVQTDVRSAIEQLKLLSHRSMILSLSLRSLLQGQRSWGHPGADLRSLFTGVHGMQYGTR